MSHQPGISKYLEDRYNLAEEFSGSDEDELSEKEETLFADVLLDRESESPDTDDEKENIMNECGRRKRMRLVASSVNRSKKNDEHVSIYGMVWEEIEIGAIPGRPTLHNIFREVPGPTGYTRRNIMKGFVKTAFSLIIDHHINEQHADFHE